MNYENLYQRGRTWYYRFMMHGEEYRGSLFTSDVKMAKKKVRALMTEYENNPPVVSSNAPKRGAACFEAMQAWDFDRTRHISSEIVAKSGVGSSWVRLKRSCLFSDAADVTEDSIGLYIRKMRDEGLSNQTIKRDLWSLRRAYDWARRQTPDLPVLPPLPRMAKSPAGKAEGRLLPLDKLMDWCQLLKPDSLAQALVVLTTGLRSEELRRLNPSWIDGQMLTLPALMTKGRRVRQMVLHPFVAEAVERCAPFATDYRKAWATAAKRAGLKRVVLRDLRHTFASQASRFDPDGTRLVMGHTTGDANAAMYYQHASHERLSELSTYIAQTFAPFIALLKA